MKRSPRILSVALAVALVSSLCAFPAYAVDDEVDQPQPSPETPAVDSATVPDAEDGQPELKDRAATDPNENELQDAAALPVGELHVRVTEGREPSVGSAFVVSVTGPDGYADSVSLGLAQGLDQDVARFKGLADGEYALRVTTPGMAPYAQAVQISGDAAAVELYAGELLVDGESAHAGVLVPGDANQDGTVDQADASAIVDAIEAGATDAACDINGDGEASLADLQMAVAYFGETQSDATVVRSVPTGAVEAAVGEGVEVEGDLSSLMDGDSLVTLKSSADAISDEHPLSVGFELAQGDAPAPKLGGVVVSSPVGNNAIDQGFVTVEFADGTSADIPITRADQPVAYMLTLSAESPTATIDENGTIVVDFKGQVAVKKVTLVITKTAGSTNLAEISKVEFLNNLEDRIPEPEMNVPREFTATPGSKKFAASWSAERNVLGYELSISAGGKEEVKRTTGISLSVSSFGGEKIKNGTTFTLKVRSVNGAWRSPWSDEITVTPKANKVPSAPEGVKLSGVYRGLKASWKKMEDTDSYNLFYREKTDSAGAYTKIEGITGTSYQVANLKDDTEYQVYLTGVNEIGEGSASLTAVERTANVKPAVLPGYRLINTQDADGRYLAHIASATHAQGSMIDSPLDEASGVAKSAFGLFDGNYASYLRVNNWDDGGYDSNNKNKGVRVTFDSPQTVDMIAFAEVENGPDYSYISVQYLDESGAWKAVPAARENRTDANGRTYTLVVLGEPVTTEQMRVGIGRYNSDVRNVIIAEMRFYAYDSLEDDIMGLYADDLHLELRDDVTATTIDALQARLDAPDEVTGDYHLFRTVLARELDNARMLLNTPGLDDTVRVHNGISSARDNRNLGIGGLNSWQPLGAVAGAGDEIVVYAGAPGKSTGSVASLKLVVSQQHPESSSVSKEVSLKVGRNVVTLPKLSSTDVERGGQLYVAYTGSNDSDAWGVRVSGATSVPTLDLYQVTDAAERRKLVTAYVHELETYVPKLKQQHDELHSASSNASLSHDFDEKNCIANATDVMLDQIMYSVPAQQLLAAVGAGSTEERAAKLLASFDGMDQMMELFYQHKGLSNSFDEGTAASVVKQNSLPSQHLNIRYTRMFAGAFMYAAGNHIGIEWDSVPGLGQASPIVLDENGAKASGNYFGWGIAHEIGHNINQSQYAYAEVTNNYFAQLSQTKETNDSVRFKYADVYDRVTSGDEGRSGNVFTQLAMYWQLRLAYDAGRAYEMYGTYQETLANRFFARVDSYARAPETAPAPREVQLALGGGESQNIMKLASAAAERDLTEFFTCWGMVPNEDTKDYMSQFPAEKRALQYESDDARAYARTHEDTGAVSGKDVARASATADGSLVTLSLGADASAGDSVLGYEIARITMADGKQQREVVGFSTGDSFTDNASSLGNRVVSYEVTAVDKFLNRSKAQVLDPIKLSGNGLLDKSGWTVETNMVSDQDTVPPTSEDDPDAPAPESACMLAVDGDASTVFTGAAEKADPVVTIDLGKVSAVTSLRYTLQGASAGTAMDAYRIETSLDGTSYTLAKEGKLDLGEDGTATLYFENEKDPWVCTYDARYLRITATGQAGKQISVGEFDVFGPSGDNVDFLDAGKGAAIGVLKSDFVYQPAGEGQDKLFIPQGSIVFTGSYKGNPAYNAVVLYDGQGNVVGGVDAAGNTVSNQIIMAPEPGNAMLGETSVGSWVYWIEPSDLVDRALPTQVRAELYRVDNAMTNEGQRLVSDSLTMAVPKTLPEIDLRGAASAASND